MLLSDANEMLKISSAQRAAMLGLFQGGSEAAGQRGFYGAGGDTPRGCPIPALGTWLPTAPEAPSLSRAIFGVQSSLPTAAQPSLGLGEPPNPPTPTPLPFSTRSILPAGFMGCRQAMEGGPWHLNSSQGKKKKLKKNYKEAPDVRFCRLAPVNGVFVPAQSPGPGDCAHGWDREGGGQTPAPRPGHQLHPNIPSPPPHPVMEEEGKGPYRLPRAVRPPPRPPPNTQQLKGGATCCPPQPHSVAPQPLICQTRGRSKRLGAGQRRGEAAHMAPAAGEGAGEGDRVKLGGRRWTQASPSLGIPSHPTGMLQVGGQNRPHGGAGGGSQQLGTQDTTQYIKQFPSILFQTPTLFPFPPSQTNKKNPQNQKTISQNDDRNELQTQKSALPH